MRIVRLLVGRPRADSKRNTDVPAPRVDVTSVRGRLPDVPLLDEIETAACEIFAAHGLPTRSGHYMRGPHDDHWTFVAEVLSPQDRWALVTAQPPEAGWRYASLGDLLGRENEAKSSDLANAARVLRATGDLRSRFAQNGERFTFEDISAAIRLGAEWRLLDGRIPQRKSEPLKLTVPARRSQAKRV